MTRLTAGDVSALPADLPHYDQELRDSVGCNLFGLACRAAGMPQRQARRRLERAAVAVVPMDSGQGTIPGFADAVRAIAAHLGCRAFVTSAADVAGIAEAYEKNSDALVAADDYRFIALATRTRRVVDNAEATARGFVAGLELMAGGLARREVLVLGCGEVGQAATAALLKRNAAVALFDLKRERSLRLAQTAAPALRNKIVLEGDLHGALRRHRLIIDATPAGGIIPEELVFPDTCLAAPGVPLGATAGAALRLRGRLLHDPLQIGVATMIMEALGP